MGEIIKILDEMNSKGVVKGGAKGRLEASKQSLLDDDEDEDIMFDE